MACFQVLGLCGQRAQGISPIGLSRNPSLMLAQISRDLMMKRQQRLIPALYHFFSALWLHSHSQCLECVSVSDSVRCDPQINMTS